MRVRKDGHVDRRSGGGQRDRLLPLLFVLQVPDAHLRGGPGLSLGQPLSTLGGAVVYSVRHLDSEVGAVRVGDLAIRDLLRGDVLGVGPRVLRKTPVVGRGQSPRL